MATWPGWRAEEAILKDHEWNEMVSSAKGGTMVVHVHGTETAHIKDDKGHLALQMHSRNIMHILYKEIRTRSEP